MSRSLRIAAADLLLLLDREALFTRRWRLSPAASQRDRLEAEQMLITLWQQTNRQKLWQPKARISIDPARREGDAIAVGLLGQDKERPGRNQNAEKRKANAEVPEISDFAFQFSDFCFRSDRPVQCVETIRLDFSAELVRQIVKRHGDKIFLVGFQVVTIGDRVADYCQELARHGKVQEQFLIHGLAAELTEALAELTQRRIQEKAGWPKARRISPGYPSWPELSEQRKLFRFVEPERIGVTLTETFQMVPEYSTSAVVIPGL